jgi:hypothetical protein
MVTAKVVEKIDIKNLQKRYQDLSNDIKNNSKNKDNVKIACARHYKNINKWVTGNFTKAGEHVILQDISYNHAFDDDDIDGYEFYVVVDGKETYFNNAKYHPKRNDLDNKRYSIDKIDKSIFAVKPKKK